MKDYYAIMGLPPNAPQAAVKARYRVLAQELHPDKPTGNEGAFKALQEAYECLGNVARRRAYDLEYKVRRFVSAPVATGFDLVDALSGVARHGLLVGMLTGAALLLALAYLGGPRQ